MNTRFRAWVFCALLNLAAVVMNTYTAIVTGSWVNVFFILFNSAVLVWCVSEAYDALGWED